jgi:S-DNA-T family DNA segregation ATPase FtsK/SpoIIIE
MLHNRPGWIDEILGIVLIVIGMVSLVAQLSSSTSLGSVSNPLSTTGNMSLAATWSDTLRTLIGYGGALVLSALVMAAGLRIILLRLGVAIRLSWAQFISLEIAYAAFLALIHLLAHDPEPRALARAGGGGGYIGWALSGLVSGLFGTGFATLVYAALLIVTIAIALGAQRVHVRKALLSANQRSIQAADRLTVWLGSLQTAAALRAEQRAQQTQAASYAPMSSVPVTASQPAAAMPDSDLTAAPPTVPPNYLTPLTNVAKGLPTAFANAVNSASSTITGTSSDTPPKPTGRSTNRGSAPMARPLGVSSTPPEPLSPEVSPERPARLERTPKSSQFAPPPPIPTPGIPVPAPVAYTPPAPPPPPVYTAERSDSNATRLVLSRPTPEAAPQQAKRFKVGDFKETRQTLKRPTGLPPLSLLAEIELNRPTEEEINVNARIIENTLIEFDIDVNVVDVRVGPTVTQYAVQPYREVTDAQGQTTTQRVRINKVASLSSDLALALSAKRLRIQPYVPGHTYMGIEVPNRTPSVVGLRPVMESAAFVQAFSRKDPDNPALTIESPLVIPLGRDVSGAPFVVNLATMPHLLIAGTTGSGKSVCLTALTLALTLINPPERLRLVMLDPKMVELTRFNGLPHLLGPVETDKERILGVLRWATREMDRRYKLLEVEAARNLDAYNRALGKRRKAEHLPYMVIIIDEIGDLMLSFPDEMERTVTRLAQMARAVGMHLVITTQRPSVDIITGLIKANFPARISFMVASGIDSRTILDAVGAETLMGRGDMLYLASDAPEPQRVQGCYVSDQELDQVMAYWAEKRTEMGYVPPIAPWERGVTRRESLVESDPVLENAIELVIREQAASASQLQRQLGVDFQRATRLMDMLQQLGVTGMMQADGRTRDVLIKPGSDGFKQLQNRRKK